jgi:hypothetical protein
MQAVTDANGKAVFTVTGLVPDTSYGVACVTKNGQGTFSALISSGDNTNSKTVKTIGKKSVTSKFATTSFKMGQTVLNAVTASLDSVPTQNSSVTVSISCPGVSGQPFRQGRKSLPHSEQAATRISTSPA